MRSRWDQRTLIIVGTVPSDRNASSEVSCRRKTEIATNAYVNSDNASGLSIPDFRVVQINGWPLNEIGQTQSED